MATQTVPIANTVELPCEGTLALLTGCDNQKTWIFSGEAGAISVGPQPGSSEWYSSPVAGLVPEQYDDSYQFTTDGEYFYENNGGTVNPYEGYVVTELAVPDTLSYLLFDGAGLNGETRSTCPKTNSDSAGSWAYDAGLTFDIVELTEDCLVCPLPSKWRLHQRGRLLLPVLRRTMTLRPLIFPASILLFSACGGGEEPTPAEFRFSMTGPPSRTRPTPSSPSM